jgi:hypothetical protein
LPLLQPGKTKSSLRILHTENITIMKKLCLILALTALPAIGFCQFSGDSVTVYIDKRVEIKIAIPDYNELKTSKKEIEALEDFKTMLPALGAKLSPATPEFIESNGGGEFTIKSGDPTTTFLMMDGEITDTGIRDRATIHGDDFTIFITSSDISVITEMPVSSCLENVFAELPDKERWSKSLSYECNDGKVALLVDKNNEFDMLELAIGAGAGLVRSTWVPDLSLKIGLGLNYKGVAQGPYVSSNLLFDFDPEKSVNLNTFLNLGYQWTMNKKEKNHDMLGIELGYLIAKKGDLFGENTIKVGFNWSPIKLVSVNPHLYISDNFKTAFPGVRIGFGF